MRLTFEASEYEQWQVLSVSGEVDVATAPSLSDRFDQLIAAGHAHIAVDLAGVEFMDSTGLRVLVTAARALMPEGRLAVVAARPNVLKIFHLTSLGEVMALCETRESLPG